MRSYGGWRLLGVALGLLAAGCDGDAPAARDDGAPVPPAVLQDAMTAAVRAQAQGAAVEGAGTVVRVLRDDTDGSRHQKFLLRLDDGTTVLVAHNIDLAPRLDGLARGDRVGFRGEYVWNPKGGTLHWTHRDPHGRHGDGWLRWNGRRYE